MDLLMKSKDPEAIKKSGVPITKVDFYNMTIDIKSVAGYLCDYD
jgi:hypothetical protein